MTRFNGSTCPICGRVLVCGFWPDGMPMVARHIRIHDLDLRADWKEQERIMTCPCKPEESALRRQRKAARQ